MTSRRLMLSASCLSQRARRFIADTRGSSLPIITAGLIPMLGAVGAAVDYSCAYMVKSQLRAAVDAAVLAGGTVAGDTTKRNEEIERYFKANFPDGYMGTQRRSFVITPEHAPDPSVSDTVNLKLKASVRMPTNFLRLFGDSLNHFDIEAEAEVATGKKFNALEAVLVLDNTWSMNQNDAGGGKSRIQALREAAKTFVDTVYAGDPSSHSSIAIGFVPYTVTVNTGWLLKSQYVQQMPPFTDKKPTSSEPLHWAGCVEAAYTVRDLGTPETQMDDLAFDTNARIPGGSVPKFMPQLVPPILTGNGESNLYKVNTPNTGVWKWVFDTWYNGNMKLAEQSITNSSGNIDTSKLRARWHSANDSGQQIHYTGYSSWSNPVAWNPANQTLKSPNAACPAESVPPRWGADKESLKNWVDNNNFPVRPGWGTISNLGMAWAYRMLRAPELFKDIVPDNPQKKPEVEAIVLMTDGNLVYGGGDDNIPTSKITREATDYQGKDGLAIGHGIYTAYRLPVEKALTAHLPGNTSKAVDQLALRLLKICHAARNSGIRVYTIAFKIDNNSQKTKDLYRSCATSPRYFFDSANSEQLKNAFRMIAVDLVQLHLVQ